MSVQTEVVEAYDYMKACIATVSSRIYYFDREGPTDVAVLLQGTLSALYRAKQKRIDAQPDDTRQAENSTYQRQGKK